MKTIPLKTAYDLIDDAAAIICDHNALTYPQVSELAVMSVEEQIQEQKFMDEAREIREADMERGWPGDGSGQDDLADYNQNEANDYANE